MLFGKRTCLGKSKQSFVKIIKVQARGLNQEMYCLFIVWMLSQHIHYCFSIVSYVLSLPFMYKNWSEQHGSDNNFLTFWNIHLYLQIFTTENIKELSRVYQQKFTLRNPLCFVFTLLRLFYVLLILRNCLNWKKK